MNYVGIDIHKRYSVCATQDGQGLKGPCQIAIEACWNRGTIYDRLAPLSQVEQVVGAPAQDAADRRSTNQER